jgi:hypothetical protein
VLKDIAVMSASGAEILCTVCDSASSDAITLPCGNIACASCLKDDFNGGVLFCQSCLKSHRGENLHQLHADESDCLDFTVTSADTLSVGDGSLDAGAAATVGAGCIRACTDIPFVSCAFAGCSARALCDDCCCAHSAQEKCKCIPSPSVAEETVLSPACVFRRLFKQENLDIVHAVRIIESARELLTAESNVLVLDAPVVTVGDIHGQFYDLCDILRQLDGISTGDVFTGTGSNLNPDTGATECDLLFDFLLNGSHQLLFLGNYVNRGSFSCEVMLGLLALKIAFPTRVHLLRGNHECSSLTHHFGFRQECVGKYGLVVYHLFCSLFKALPLAATVRTKFGVLLACHGGPSPAVRSLADLQNINRWVTLLCLVDADADTRIGLAY